MDPLLHTVEQGGGEVAFRWFHVDGAYGGVAAMLPDQPEELRHLALADSVAVDPHKWLHAPPEIVVREGRALWRKQR